MKLEDHLVQSTFLDEGQKLHMHLLVVARQLDLMLRRILKPHGITPPQYNVLRILRGQKGMPIAVQSLAARMIDPSSNTSRIIDKLVDKGWADRQVCPEDRRRADVSITPTGTDILTKLDIPIQTLLAHSLEGITDSTRVQMNAALAQVLNNTDDILSSQS